MLPAGYDLAVERLDDWMRLKYSFDVIGRKMSVGDRKATMYFVDGFIKDEIMEKIMEFTMKLTPEDLRDALLDAYVNYLEYVVTDEDRDPTEQEMREIQKKRQAMYEECMKEGL